MNPPVPVTISVSKPLLPEDWQEALRWVETVARRVQLAYAIVGSLGVALALDLPWEPTRRSRLDGSVSPRDLDIFLMGDQWARRQFREALGSRSSNSGPKKIDAVAMYHLLTEFGPSGPALRYRSLRVPVDPKLFTPVLASSGRLVIPVLHPKVHVHLIGQQPRLLGKGTSRVRSMARGLARGHGHLPAITEAECRVFHGFKSARRQWYPVHERILAARMVFGHWEEAGRQSPLVALKAHVRRHHPRVTNALRRLLD